MCSLSGMREEQTLLCPFSAIRTYGQGAVAHVAVARVIATALRFFFPGIDGASFFLVLYVSVS